MFNWSVKLFISFLFIISNKARKALDIGHKAVKPGVTTDEIDKIVHEFIISQGGYPSPLNYRGFPKSLCTYKYSKSIMH